MYFSSAGPQSTDPLDGLQTSRPGGGACKRICLQATVRWHNITRNNPFEDQEDLLGRFRSAEHRPYRYPYLLQERRVYIVGDLLSFIIHIHQLNNQPRKLQGIPRACLTDTWRKHRYEERIRLPDTKTWSWPPSTMPSALRRWLFTRLSSRYHFTGRRRETCSLSCLRLLESLVQRFFPWICSLRRHPFVT